jgi:hypothetical protein
MSLLGRRNSYSDEFFTYDALKKLRSDNDKQILDPDSEGATFSDKGKKPSSNFACFAHAVIANSKSDSKRCSTQLTPKLAGF